MSRHDWVFVALPGDGAAARGILPAMPGAPALRVATLDDLLRAVQEERRCEIIDGVIVEKAPADEGHGDAQSEVVEGSQ